MANISPVDEARLRLYPEIEFGGFSRCDGTVAFAGRVHALLAPGQKVIDIGCGRGSRMEDLRAPWRRALQDLRGDGRKVVGLDPDPRAATNPFIDEFRLLNHGAPWPIDNGEADVVYGDYVLEHVDNPEHFFAELARVVRVGGVVCFRTPNRWCYPALVAQCLPNRVHPRLTAFAQSDRKPEDVFPTRYRCNSKRALIRLMRRHGFAPCVLSMEAEPSYLSFSPLLYALAARIHAVLPPALRSTLLVFGRRVSSTEGRST